MSEPIEHYPELMGPKKGPLASPRSIWGQSGKLEFNAWGELFKAWGARRRLAYEYWSRHSPGASVGQFQSMIEDQVCEDLGLPIWEDPGDLAVALEEL